MTSFTQLWGIPTSSPNTNMTHMVHSVSSPALSQLSHSYSSNSNSSDTSVIPFYCQNPACRKPIELEDSLCSNLEIWIKSQHKDTSLQHPTSDNIQNSTSDSKTEDNENEHQNHFKKWLEKSSSNIASPGLKNSKSWTPGTKEQCTRFQEIFCGITDWMEPTSLEFPLCAECAQKSLRSLEKDLGFLKSQKTTIDRAFLKYSQVFTETLQESYLDAQLLQAEQEERQLLEELSVVEGQLSTVSHESHLLDQYHRHILSLELEHSQYDQLIKTDIKDFLEESEAYVQKANELKAKLYVLGSTNVLNDCFHIWVEGHFGTINGLRLGTLPSQPVDWIEINGAWGYVILLLDLIASNLRFSFPSFRLIFLGSFSKLERKSDGALLELFGNNDFMLGKWFWARRYEAAMTGVLTCIKDLSDFFHQKLATFQLPFRIEKDKIHGYSIKYQFSDEETWTKALKYLLTDLKYLLAFFVKSISSS